MKSAGLLLLVGLLVFCAELSLISGQPDICRLPKVEGSCFALISRYFFNTRTKKCEKFSYGGCRGNANNFKTLEKCRRTCEWKPGRCPKPIETGLCTEFCHSDHSCPGKQKCCSNSCGHSCKNPILLVEP